MPTNNKIMIYDDSCPLCSGYTKLFVNMGLLSKGGRTPFTGIDTLV